MDRRFDKVDCEIKDVNRTAEAGVHIGRHLEHSLLHECVKPSGTMVFPDYCSDKGFRHDMERSIHHILRDVDRLNRDFEHRHRHCDCNNTTTTTTTTPAA